ncbi:hydroxysqualene dehydroxylase HpnE [Asanoa sp. WMMD1127]|uniref:hydroxysqualene dehydroxylase HpnE n=1 Tax=Asanoa sp. WMMD1127 TaxID=3016107 RepID=UPI002416B425|nr:hydroxysqualene dehydroxylase HpnE [Asanoa sp. WMMD1127]MDG4827491.1 hydroxysqualene dehydroxylase HpnE [Asanoa sp. WMMD1127]
MTRADVVVVGGGLAGITAALRLADAGRRVTLVETKPWLGGLTYSFHRGDLDVDNGQHVFLRCCTAYRALLDRLGVTGQTHLQDRLDIAVRQPGVGEARLRRNGLPAPLHLGGALLGYRLLNPVQRLKFTRAALAMKALDRTDPALDERSFGDWLREQGQDEQTVRAMWDLVGLATLNVPADEASLALAAMVFQVGLLTDNDAADIGWATVPLRELHGAAAEQALAEAGVTVRTGTKVEAVEPGFTVRLRDADDLTADQVVLAVPPAAAHQLAPEVAAADLDVSPIVNVHLVLDRPVLTEPFVAGVGTPIQWVFDRTASSGLAARRPGAQYLAVSLSAAAELVDLPVARLRELLFPDLLALFPALAEATVDDFFVTRERTATFRAAPGSQRLRPPAVTAVPGLFLAGAWTDTGWPATMEGAVRSGDTAADAALDASTVDKRAGRPAAAGPQRRQGVPA